MTTNKTNTPTDEAPEVADPGITPRRREAQRVLFLPNDAPSLLRRMLCRIGLCTGGPRTLTGMNTLVQQRQGWLHYVRTCRVCHHWYSMGHVPPDTASTLQALRPTPEPRAGRPLPATAVQHD